LFEPGVLKPVVLLKVYVILPIVTKLLLAGWFPNVRVLVWFVGALAVMVNPFTAKVCPALTPLEETEPVLEAFVPTVAVNVVPLTLTVPVVLEPLNVPVCDAFTGGLAVNTSEVKRLGLLIVVVSPPVRSLDEKVPEKAPVLLANVAAPL
jgi:hypothetical protein